MPGRKASPRHSLLDAIEGHYASQALLVLSRLGILDALARPRDPGALAKAARVDPVLLAAILEFLRQATNVVERDRAGRYRLGPPSLPEIVFQLEKFVGAYGNAVRGLDAILRGMRPAGGPDETALATAFGAAAGVRTVEADLVRQMGVRHLLDLGCGTGALLVQLARDDSAFRGIGVDGSPVMCRIARARVRSARLGSRIRIRRADARQVQRVLEARDVHAVEMVHGRSLLNALLGRGEADAVAFLRKLRRLLPGRTGLFVDYYGELNRQLPGRRRFRLGQLQDVAQLASAQGLPPPDRKAWNALFRQAGCRVISTLDVRGDDIRWFIRHIQF